MISLQGLLTSADLANVRDKTRLMFKDPDTFLTPEAVIVHEQNLLSDEVLLKACNEIYHDELKVPKREYIPQDIIIQFKDLNCVPISYSASTMSITVGVIPEMGMSNNYRGDLHIIKVRIPIYYYVDIYTDLYGMPDFLLPLPTKDYLDFIWAEAIKLGASDITIYNNTRNTADVIYNVRKRIVHSRRRLSGEAVLQIAQILGTTGGATFDPESLEPRYFTVRVDIHNRGRVVVNKTYHGWSITVRVLSDEYLDMSLEDLNIAKKTIDFTRDIFLSSEKGLRLVIGETSSGKNTYILSSLMELIAEDKYKITSVENPVETLVRGLIQIDAETEDLFRLNADSLLRQNPDIVYFTEITEKTAYAIIKQANTSKAVFTSIHANSIADVISRLVDITKVDPDRIIQTIQSCVYIVLVRDETLDKVYPENRCVHFTEDLKCRLYGKPLYQIREILRGEELKWTL